MTNKYDGFEWQHLDDSNWAFGLKVRGVVRERFAEVYFDDDLGWAWLVTYDRTARGFQESLSLAIVAAEKALGIL